MGKRDVQNQLSLFDLVPESKHKEPPQLLEIGQRIYKVVRGEVIESYVERTYLCGENGSERGYHVTGDCVWNKSLGVDVFTEFEKAEEVAERYINSHDVILVRDMPEIIEYEKWYRVRKVDGRKLVAYFGVFKNGMVYIKDYYTYHHIINCGSIEGARKYIQKYKDQQEKLNLSKYSMADTEPMILKNMYKCREESEWVYAEATYTGCI